MSEGSGGTTAGDEPKCRSGAQAQARESRAGARFLTRESPDDDGSPRGSDGFSR